MSGIFPYFWTMKLLKNIASLLWKMYFGICFVISAIFFYPIILPFLFSEQGKKKSFKLFVAWSWTVRIFAFIRVKKIVDAELPKEPFIITANHTSYLDIFLLPSILPTQRFLYLGKSEILHYPLLKTYFKRLNIPVYRNNAIKSARSFIRARKEMEKGWSLMIFPEGEIPEVEHPKMVPFKDGAFQLAKNAKVPIVPLTFMNNFELFGEPEVFFSKARPGTSYVYIHPFISKEQVMSLSKEELNKQCFDIIASPFRKNQ